MDVVLHRFQHLKIQLEKIISATNNFDDKNNRIGVGGFGKVYKGEVTHSNGRSMVAIKRLDPKHGQGIPEFLKEITMLSGYRHTNLISLLGFCCEGGEMILVYELASHGSLDRHLSSLDLTWIQRLKICIDIAKGLDYLHDPRGTHQRLIHCDIKSGNILLDDQWNAKVSDFGLSIMGPANEQYSDIVTPPSGTYGYCDPQYAMTNTLTKESDVYSFGVVLFEVLCGKLCYRYSNGHVQEILVPMWIESYKQKNLIEIIFKNSNIQQLDRSALQVFSDIVYRCLNESRKYRPKMAEIVTELESAFESQEYSDWEPPFGYREMIKTAEPPLNYISNGELRKLLSKGVLLNDGKTWFSLNKKGEHCEMKSFVDCLGSNPSEYERAYNNSRFVAGTYRYKDTSVDSSQGYKDGFVKTSVKTQFLTPGITYTVNLVLKFIKEKDNVVALRYKLQGEIGNSFSYLGYKREDGWWMCELYQIFSDSRIIDLEILFDLSYRYGNGFIHVEGIEFRPLEKVEHKNEKQPISDSDAHWEEKLPDDYEDMMKWSTNSVQWTTKKEAYSFLRKGFLIEDGQTWFSLDENGKKCHMISSKATKRKLKPNPKDMQSSPESRFGEALEWPLLNVDMDIKIQHQLLSPETTYATYLVYKLPKDQSRYDGHVKLLVDGKNRGFMYLVSPQTPVIRPKADQNTHSPLNKPKLRGFPRQRKDGWMEVQIWEFRTPIATEMVPIQINIQSLGPRSIFGLRIEGFEFRPI